MSRILTSTRYCEKCRKITTHEVIEGGLFEKITDRCLECREAHKSEGDGNGS